MEFLKRLGITLLYVITLVVIAFICTTIVAAIMSSIHDVKFAEEIINWNNWITTVFKFLHIVKA